MWPTGQPLNSNCVAAVCLSRWGVTRLARQASLAQRANGRQMSGRLRRASPVCVTNNAG